MKKIFCFVVFILLNIIFINNVYASSDFGDYEEAIYARTTNLYDSNGIVFSTFEDLLNEEEYN